MFLNKIGEGMEVDGITYTVGQRSRQIKTPIMTV